MICLYRFLILIFFITTPHAIYPTTQVNYITYGLSGGRFGNNILSLLKSLSVSLKYNLPLRYKKFEYSDQLMLDQLIEPLNTQMYCIRCKDEKDLLLPRRNSCLYDFSYYAHAADWSDWDQGYFPLKVDPIFLTKARELIKPKYPLQLIPLPQDRITVAVHIRRGGGYDTPLLAAEEIPTKPVNKRNYVDYAFPLIFLPDQFYIEQIRNISELYNDQPMYIYIFTDDKNPERFIDLFKKTYAKPNIVFDYRKGNYHNKNVLEDFFSIQQFDCLIRSDSTFAKSTQILGNFEVVIYPENASWQQKGHKYSLIVDKVAMVIKEDKK